MAMRIHEKWGHMTRFNGGMKQRILRNNKKKFSHGFLNQNFLEKGCVMTISFLPCSGEEMNPAYRRLLSNGKSNYNELKQEPSKPLIN